MKSKMVWAAAGLMLLGAGHALAQDRGAQERGGRGPGQGIERRGPERTVVPPINRTPVTTPLPRVVRPVEPPRRPYPVFAPLPRIPVWTSAFPYQARYHDTCQRKAWRLRWFERRASADGYLSGGERSELSALRRDLRRTCGDWRWRD